MDEEEELEYKEKAEVREQGGKMMEGEVVEVEENWKEKEEEKEKMMRRSKNRRKRRAPADRILSLAVNDYFCCGITTGKPSGKTM